MPKRIIRDIVDAGTASRDIVKHSRVVEPIRRKQSQHILRNESSHGAQRFGMWTLTGVVIVILVFIVAIAFSNTVVEVSPLQAEVAINGDFRAIVGVVTDGELPFRLVTVKKEASVALSAMVEEQVERKAHGMIVVFNAYSANPQRLIKNTRFETTDGKIYRIDASVEVPGMTKGEGKNIPGSVEVVVYADNSGDEYNIGPTDFTIPGFKGDPRYSAFYARSKTPMTGGVRGAVKTASEESISEAREQLQATIKADLLQKINADIPNDAVVYDGGIFFRFTDGDATVLETQGESLTIAEKATAHGMIFNKKQLGIYLANRNIPTYNGASIVAHGIEDMKLIVADNMIDVENVTAVDFHLSGKLSFEWDIDEEALLNDLVGIPKANFPNVVESYPSIKRAQAIVRPFWRDTFPTEKKDIVVKKVYDTVL